jgi:hypothetical protein
MEAWVAMLALREWKEEVDGGFRTWAGVRSMTAGARILCTNTVNACFTMSHR